MPAQRQQQLSRRGSVRPGDGRCCGSGYDGADDARSFPRFQTAAVGCTRIHGQERPGPGQPQRQSQLCCSAHPSAKSACCSARSPHPVWVPDETCLSRSIVSLAEIYRIPDDHPYQQQEEEEEEDAFDSEEGFDDERDEFVAGGDGTTRNRIDGTDEEEGREEEKEVVVKERELERKEFNSDDSGEGPHVAGQFDESVAAPEASHSCPVSSSESPVARRLCCRRHPNPGHLQILLKDVTTAAAAASAETGSSKSKLRPPQPENANHNRPRSRRGSRRGNRRSVKLGSSVQPLPPPPPQPDLSTLSQKQQQQQRRQQQKRQKKRQQTRERSAEGRQPALTPKRRAQQPVARSANSSARLPLKSKQPQPQPQQQKQRKQRKQQDSTTGNNSVHCSLHSSPAQRSEGAHSVTSRAEAQHWKESRGQDMSIRRGALQRRSSQLDAGFGLPNSAQFHSISKTPSKAAVTLG